jgi:thiol-disulfide isomerase/thioredoxin
VVEETVVQEPIVAATPRWTYKEYNGSIEWKSVLFFAAAWCPSCVAADKGFSAENELAIDADILKVDYDNSSDLKAKYGVTSQHTFVLVDAEGNMIKKMAWGTKSSDLLALFN